MEELELGLEIALKPDKSKRIKNNRFIVNLKFQKISVIVSECLNYSYWQMNFCVSSSDSVSKENNFLLKQRNFNKSLLD